MQIHGLCLEFPKPLVIELEQDVFQLRNAKAFLIPCLFVFTLTDLCTGHQMRAMRPLFSSPIATVTGSAGLENTETRPAVDTNQRTGADRSSRGARNAPVTIIEFSDFECPFSGKVQQNIQELLRANPEKIRLLFKHSPLPFHLHSRLAHEAALAAGAQGKFWEMHDLLFANQGRLEKDDLLQYARQLSLDVESFRQALESHLYGPIVEENLEEAKGLNVTGTPTFFINGKKIVGAQSLETMKAAVDEALGLPSGPGVNPPNGNTAAGTAAALPAVVEKVEIGASHIRGAEEAPVTIVEFSDFQCPFCGRALPTVQELLRRYPKGVRWVFKNFPLDFHPDSLLAHKAALAAGEQGKFWEMHDLIFANQSAIRRDDLVLQARQLGLDMSRFIADLDSSRFQTVIDAIAPPREAKRPAIPSLKPGVTTKGPESAPITLTWYCDLESPLSPQAARLVSEIEAGYPEKIRVVFRNLPLEFHAHAALAHQAMLAAGAQGKFWQMQQLILAGQNKMTRDDLVAHAQTLGLNRAKFIAALDGRLYQSVIDEDASEARQQGVYGVPVFFVNGKRMDGLQPLAMFRNVIDGELTKTQSAAGQ